MTTTDSTKVRVTGEEISAAVKSEAFTILENSIPGIRDKVNMSDVSVRLEKDGASIKTVFECSILSVIDYSTNQIITSKLVFEESKIQDLFISRVLKNKKISDALNMNTPVKNTEYKFVHLPGNKDTVLSFDFSITYDSSDDFK